MPRFLYFLRPTAEAPPPPPPSSISAALSIIREHTPNALRAACEDFLRDKSHSEILFLASILLAVLLFVVILPACEALFGYDCEACDEAEKETEVKMRMYKAGVGVVEVEVGDLPEPSLKRLSSGGSTNSTRSCCSLDTIEESEEEYLEEEEEEEAGSSIVTSEREGHRQDEGEASVGCRETEAASTPIHSLDDERQDAPLFPKEESASGFLHFVNSESKVRFADPVPDLDESQDLSVEGEDEGGNYPFGDLLALRYRAYEAAREEGRMGLSLDHPPREVMA